MLSMSLALLMLAQPATIHELIVLCLTSLSCNCVLLPHPTAIESSLLTVRRASLLELL